QELTRMPITEAVTIIDPAMIRNIGIIGCSGQLSTLHTPNPIKETEMVFEKTRIAMAMTMPAGVQGDVLCSLFSVTKSTCTSK
ncbi:hypothetical protein PENTCL1PPCAC_14151, partial [Pristionchus entomophagus]